MPDQENRLSILELINQVAADEETRDKVSVLPLMCGTGKSTAIRHKIKQVIESLDETGAGDGIIVMTDTLAGLESYIKPENDKPLREYFKSHKDKICLVTAENAEEAIKKQQYCPVLLMTTQRYFKLTKSKIKSFLSWEKGKRSLIIFDEMPFLIENHNLDRPLLTHLEDELLRVLCLDDPNKHYNSETCEILKEKVFRLLSQLLQKIPLDYCSDEHKTLYAYCEQPFQYDEVRFYFENRKKPKRAKRTNDSEIRSVREYIVEDDGTELPLFDAEELSELADDFIDDLYDLHKNVFGLKKLIIKHKNYIADDTMMLYTTLCQFMKKGGLACFSLPYQRYSLNSYMVTWNNRELLCDLPSKVIVLDGTGDVHPDYEQPYITVHDCMNYRRPLSLLTIKIINYAASKTNLNNMTQSQLKSISNNIQEYLKEQHPDIKEQIPVFSYKDFESSFRDEDEGEGIVSTAHFGAIKGRNDFVDKTVIAQVGIFMKPESYYLSMYLELHPEIIDAPDFEKQIPSGSMFMKDVEEVQAQYDDIIDTEDYEAYKAKCILTDIEQNVFRCAIRNPDSDEPVTYYIFTNTNTEAYRPIIEKIQARFEGYGATVSIIDKTPSALLMKKMKTRKSSDGKGSLRLQFLEFRNSKANNEAYTKQEIKDALGISDSQWQNLRDWERINEILKADHERAQSLGMKKNEYVRAEWID